MLRHLACSSGHSFRLLPGAPPPPQPSEEDLAVAALSMQLFGGPLTLPPMLPLPGTLQAKRCRHSCLCLVCWLWAWSCALGAWSAWCTT